MSSSGTKSKKKKASKKSLQSFHAEDLPPHHHHLTMAIKSWSAECAEEEEERLLPKTIQLPSASRATRVLDDDLAPQSPPFVAFISNLPFEMRETDISNLFSNMQIVHMNFPRNNSDDRIKGYGYVTFETRNDLIQAISLPDPHIMRRRIQITYSNKNSERRNNRDTHEPFGWRRDHSSTPQEKNTRSGGFDFSSDRLQWNSSQVAGSSNWSSKKVGRKGEGFQNQEGECGSFPAHGRHHRKDFNRVRPTPPSSDNTAPEERRKLNLTARSTPMTAIITHTIESEREMESEQAKSAGNLTESIFGSAKPVDTAARENEILERLRCLSFKQLESVEEEREEARESLY